MSAQPLLYVGLSAALHLGLLAESAAFMPPVCGDPCNGDEYGLTSDQRETLTRLLATADAKELEAQEAEPADSDAGGEDDTCTRTRCDEGTMGGPLRDEMRDAAREYALRDASEFAVTTLCGTAPGEWVSPWLLDEPIVDESIARRAFWDDEMNPFLAVVQPRLSGVGDDDRRPDLGIGLGSLGPGMRAAPRFASRAALFFGSGRRSRAHVRAGAASVSGRLPAEVVQRVLRQQLGRARLCYENGLRYNPVLQGHVTARLVIGLDGSVSHVGNAGSDMPDSGVVKCVVRSYYGLTFPRPESGFVAVVYPIVFSP